MPSWPSALPRTPRLSSMPRLRRPSLALVVSLLLATALLLGGWVWLRDSSLVAVENVTVTGASGLGAPAVRSSLTGAAHQMTTLNVDRGALDAAVARFPLVKSISVTTKFPHAMAIVVHERRPVAALVWRGGALAVAADGVILSGIPSSGLPVIAVASLVRGRRVVDPTTASEVTLIAGAPRRLRAEVTELTTADGGFVVRLRSGTLLRFGDGSRFAAKWIAADRVLQDPQAAGAGYIDLSIPERPASGVLAIDDAAATAGQ